MEFDDLSNKVIGCALEVHRHLGPGLLESAYAQCLAHELSAAGIPFELECPIPVSYKGKRLDCGFRADIVVDESLLVELKSVQELLPIHEAQLLTYMKLAEVRIGLLINFNVRMLRDGLKRMVL
jgi:GxxExxY protein